MNKILRWTKFRKAEILNQIDENPTQANKIMIFHDLSLEEIAEWRKALSSHGIQGLRSTRLQHYYQKPRTKMDIYEYAHLNYYTPKTKAKAPTK